MIGNKASKRSLQNQELYNRSQVKHTHTHVPFWAIASGSLQTQKDNVELVIGCAFMSHISGLDITALKLSSEDSAVYEWS